MVRVMPLSPHLRVEVPLLPPEKFRGLCILWKLYGYMLVTSDNLYTNNMSICWGGFVCFYLSGISISMIRLCSETKQAKGWVKSLRLNLVSKRIIHSTRSQMECWLATTRRSLCLMAPNKLSDESHSAESIEDHSTRPNMLT